MDRSTKVSRVEVAILMVAAALTVGIALSAISQVRESAARMTCSNNLKALGIAAHDYRDSFQSLPPLVDQGQGSWTGNGLVSAFAALTPYLEAYPRIYNYLGDRSPPDYYHAHSAVPFTYQNKDGTPGTQRGGDANQFWRAFIDPSDGTAGQLRDVPMTLPDGTTGYYATGSYAANGQLPWGTCGFPASSQSNVVLFTERPQVCRTAAGDAVHNLWGVGFYSPSMPAFAALTPSEPPGLWSTGQVVPVGSAQVRVGRLDANPVPPDFRTQVQILRSGRACDPRLPASPHAAGLLATMADTSVRVFGPDTDPWVFWAVCTLGGTAPIDLDR